MQHHKQNGRGTFEADFIKRKFAFYVVVRWRTIEYHRYCAKSFEGFLPADNIRR